MKRETFCRSAMVQAGKSLNTQQIGPVHKLVIDRNFLYK